MKRTTLSLGFNLIVPCKKAPKVIHEDISANNFPFVKNNLVALRIFSSSLYFIIYVLIFLDLKVFFISII